MAGQARSAEARQTQEQDRVAGKGLVAVDLHIHTALSPCGDESMRPGEVLLSAERRGIAVVGIVDHCTARNAKAFLDASAAFDVRVLVGLEVESAEGVHILALFDSLDAATDMDRLVADHLPDLRNRPDVLGDQQLLDAWGHVIGTDDRLLVTATDLTIEQIARHTADRRGLSIPAHVDRSLNGLFRVLGMVPPGLRVPAFEVSASTTPDKARERWPQLAEICLLTSSDAHVPEDIGRAMTFVSPDLARAELDACDWGEELKKELCPGGGGGA